MWFDLSVVLGRDGCDPGSGLRIEIAAHIDVGLCFGLQIRNFDQIVEAFKVALRAYPGKMETDLEGCLGLSASESESHQSGVQRGIRSGISTK